MEAEALHDFKPSDHDTELEFKKGDKLRILNLGDDVQWFNAEMGDRKGLVPCNYLHIEHPRWYAGRISRSLAENFLLANEQPEGAFLMRLSESAPTEFSLSVKCGSQVQHFRILRDDRNEHQYFLWTTRFSSLNKLVEYYKTETVSRTSKIFLRDMISEPNSAQHEGPILMAQAIYDFAPDDSQEGETELAFRKGEFITVFDSKDENWWGGRINDREGYFPKLYVKLCEPSNN